MLEKYTPWVPECHHIEEIVIAWEVFNVLKTIGTRNKYKRINFLSTPFTTGPRYVEWIKERGRSGPFDGQSLEDYREEKRINVIVPNTESALNNLDALVLRTNQNLIHPVLVNYKEWTQMDYYVFWGKVLGEFTDVCFLSPGWEMSNGCVYELYRSLVAGKFIYEFRNNNNGSVTEYPLSLDFVDKCNYGRNALKEVGVNTEFMDKVIMLIKEYLIQKTPKD